MEQAASPGSHCRLFQDPTGNFPWTQTSGRTPSGRISNRRVNGVLYPVTGPNSAAQGFYYIYIEASGQEQGSLARSVLIKGQVTLDLYIAPTLPIINELFSLNTKPGGASVSRLTRAIVAWQFVYCVYNKTCYI